MKSILMCFKHSHFSKPPCESKNRILHLFCYMSKRFHTDGIISRKKWWVFIFFSLWNWKKSEYIFVIVFVTYLTHLFIVRKGGSCSISETLWIIYKTKFWWHSQNDVCNYRFLKCIYIKCQTHFENIINCDTAKRAR